MTSQVRKPGAASPHIPGEAELWIFILGDMLVFALFFGIWSVNHALKPELFSQSHAQINQTLGLINTLALLTSSWCVALGLNHAREGFFTVAGRWFRRAAALGGLFIAVKFVEYREKIIAGVDALNNEFFMYYFVFTGIHLLHVLVGLLALWLMMRRCANPKPDLGDMPFLEGAGVYWHMVDVLWIVWFLLIYLI